MSESSDDRGRPTPQHPADESATKEEQVVGKYEDQVQSRGEKRNSADDQWPFASFPQT